MTDTAPTPAAPPPSTPAAPPPPSTPVPEWILIQSSDLGLRQVSRGVIDGAPEWWRSRFGAKPKFPPRALRTHLDMPVFGIDVPLAALDVMLEMIQVPENINDYWTKLPPFLAAEGIVTLKTWRGYMRAYGFVDTQDLNAEFDDDDDGPARKRQRLNPFQETLEEIATTLHTYIFANHPDAEKYTSGRSRFLSCWFVTKYDNPKMAYTGTVRTFEIPCPAGPSGHLQVGHYLFTYLTDEHLQFVRKVLVSLSPAGTRVTTHCVHKYEPHVKAVQDKGREITGWPLSPTGKTPVTVYQRVHSVNQISFAYE